MRKRPLFHVKKRTLLAVAGCVWLIAGFNVARLGVLSYLSLTNITALHIILSVLIFCAFGLMFFKMSMKHTKRIKGYREQYRPVWHFFDLKAYIIMAVMMGGGIWLRSSGLAPDVFIAVFYTGLGCALALAGIIFGIVYFGYKTNTDIEP
ncbi:MAG: hypothetical protein Q4E21_03785 [Clostridia bacterium]|nr:hypothetical protein [Clostridia bacterium]